MPNKKLYIIIAVICISIITIFAVSAQNGFFTEDDAIYQVSTMQVFMHGDYDGVISLSELKSHGDTGIGTFEGVDGEMIILDGVYQAKADGTIHEMKDNETTPFATITHFNEDSKLQIRSAKNFDDLTNQLDNEIVKYGVNNMYVVKIHGNFSNMNVRSIEKQNEPYKEFNEVAKVDQKVFNYTNETGTIIAIYFPSYMNELNMHGWHLHFISDDKTKGGHVLGLTMTNGNGNMDKITEFNMILPSTDSFANMNLTENMTNKIKAVE